jgi:hypothetical protein
MRKNQYYGPAAHCKKRAACPGLKKTQVPSLIFFLDSINGSQEPLNGRAAIFGVGGQTPHNGFGQLLVDLRSPLADVDREF